MIFVLIDVSKTFPYQKTNKYNYLLGLVEMLKIPKKYNVIYTSKIYVCSCSCAVLLGSKSTGFRFPSLPTSNTKRFFVCSINVFLNHSTLFVCYLIFYIFLPCVVSLDKQTVMHLIQLKVTQVVVDEFLVRWLLYRNGKMMMVRIGQNVKRLYGSIHPDDPVVALNLYSVGGV